MHFEWQFYWPLSNSLFINGWVEDRSPLTCITQSESWSVFTASHTPTGELTTNLHRHLQYVVVILSTACDLRLISSCLGAAFWLPLEIDQDKKNGFSTHLMHIRPAHAANVTDKQSSRSSRYREGNHPATHPSVLLQKHHDFMSYSSWIRHEVKFFIMSDSSWIGHDTQKNTLPENTVGSTDSSGQSFSSLISSVIVPSWRRSSVW